jgi:hypothetical protein
MAGRQEHDDRLERAMDQLAESLLRSSDETIIADVIEMGSDPQAEAEYTRQRLQEASDALDCGTRRLSDLGHEIDPRSWVRGLDGYHNHCLRCGSPVSITAAGVQAHREALARLCSGDNQYLIRRRQASGK